MKNQKHYSSFLNLFFLLGLLCFSSCIKKSAYAERVIGLNSDTLITIKNLRKLHLTNRIEPITKTWAIEGVVVGNDEHDNIYKSIIIQDSTGGIVLLLEGTGLYQNFPVGAFLHVRIQNLFLTDYRKMQQLVAAVDTSNGSLVTGGLPVPLFEKHITTLSDNFNVIPISVAFRNLSDSLQGRLIKITDVEFSATDTGQTFADYKNKIGASRALKFCTGGTIYLRTSGYADFAGIATPTGNGSVVGIYSVYNSEKQLIIRDTSDILLKNKRCTGAAWLQNLPH
jgi:hypothetical protein